MFDFSDADESVLDRPKNVPDGDYLCNIVACETKVSKNDSNTKFFSFEFTVVRGPYEGMRIFNNFMFQHSNQKAVNIGRARMKQLCMLTTGKAQLGDTLELAGKPIWLRVKTTKKGEYENLNILKMASAQVGFTDTPVNQDNPLGVSAPQSQPPAAQQPNPLDNIPFG